MLEDFLGMEPVASLQGKMAQVDGFLQRQPRDGQPASQRTVVYLGYDDKKLYVVFVAFDSQVGLVRARMARREDIHDDDLVEVVLDSFHDQRRAYSFVCNPLGIQLDRLYAEGSGFDESFDTLWDSQGKLTPAGYVVRMAIPFRSLRFPSSGQSWGIVLQRIIPRENEHSFWPRVSSRISGLLNQEATLDGIQSTSPGRNIQLTPYGVLRSFRSLDSRDPAHPVFEKKDADSRFGLESKFVLKDRLVFDLAVNPDFSQVESDEPQVTVNQRFEVFFPEKRQFFLENASFFETPINLLFTRRIGDPLVTARMTGKAGRYAIGALFSDDRRPGETVAASDPLSGQRAHFGLFRLNRDIGKGSTLGVIFAERDFAGEFNRVGGLDLHLKIGKNWTAAAQALSSSTRSFATTGPGVTPTFKYSSGPAFEIHAQRNSRKLRFDTLFLDFSPGFATRTGFLRQSNIREFSTFSRYSFRPEGRHLISHGPGLFQKSLWSHDGTRLDHLVNLNYRFEFARQTTLGAFANVQRERLRASDSSALLADHDYPLHHHGIFFDSAFFKWLSVGGEAGWGTETNYAPASGPPVSARANYINVFASFRPTMRLSIDNTYLLSRLRSGQTAAIFNNHIIRSKWNYQINREFSVRFITQYASTLANPQLTTLQYAKNLNFDFLITYLLHPGTAIYVGYNSNLQNLDPSLGLDPGLNILRTRDLATNDGRQFFVKLSYQFRF
ncbi:MAG: DUF5916 domain-containing protein [Candidatus Acidiferrum sp.]